MKLAFALVLAIAAVPAISMAGDRWDNGGRGRGGDGGRDRGYRYDRGERYYDRGHSSRSRSSFGFTFGFGSSGYRDYTYGSFSYGNRGYYRPSPPVVYRETYIAPRYEYSSRHYECAPVRSYYAPAPKVYYYDGGCSTGSGYSGSVYYYRR
ncbi:MAG TPA: hypothetical protein PLD59_05745 [Tepidisphaeraceae bacterium]|nr:hypothetical protein [Tepidisphaeraceae bacterium]